MDISKAFAVTDVYHFFFCQVTKAPQAAGKIHTDFERGFIKAEVVNYQDLLDNGSLAAAREKGIVGMEGKEYVVKDGDVILFRFNV